MSPLFVLRLQLYLVLSLHMRRVSALQSKGVCQVSVRAPSVALARRPPTVWPAFRGHPPPLSLPVSPHMRPRCRRESPLSHGLLLFRFPPLRGRVCSPHSSSLLPQSAATALPYPPPPVAHIVKNTDPSLPRRVLSSFVGRVSGRKACKVSRDSV